MTNQGFFDVGYMDTLASGDSALHRIDPRAKLVATIAFIAAVASFNRYAVLELIPFFSFPLFLILAGGLPVGYLLKKVLLVAPFAVLVGIFNPFFDRSIICHIGPMAVTGGWVSFTSILLRCVLTVTAALALIALTGFNAVCAALERFGVPRPFIVQLLFLYRYMFVLTEESERMTRAREVRSFSDGAMPMSTFVPFIGNLLLRALDRAERVYRAMCCRGFDGHIRIARTLKLGYTDIAFAVLWVALFISFRAGSVPLKVGEFVVRICT